LFVLESVRRTVPVRIDAARRLIVMLQAVAIALSQSLPAPAPSWAETTYRPLAGRVTGSMTCLVTGFMRIRKAENDAVQARHRDPGPQWAGEMLLWLFPYPDGIC
jgi:hypothetical protein